MGKKLPSHGPNILKHLQKNFRPYKGRWIYALSWIFIAPWEPFSLHCSAPSLSDTGTQGFVRNLELIISWKKCLDSTNGSIALRRQTRPYNAGAVKLQRERERRGYQAQICTSPPSRRPGMKHDKCQGTFPCMCVETSYSRGAKDIVHIIFLKSAVWFPWRHIIYATMKRAAEDDMSIWWECDRGEEQMLWWKGCQSQIHKSSWGHECISDDTTETDTDI